MTNKKAKIMKKQVLNLVMACSVMIFSSCHKSHDDLGGNNNNNNGNAISGAWRVTLFTDSGNDETSDFSGFSFNFNDNGSLDAVRDQSTFSGTWTRGSKFIIDLGPKGDGNRPLGELTDDWHIISITSTEIKLGDDNPSSGEFLTFSKN